MGTLPYDIHETENGSKLLAQLNAPSFGLRINYQKAAPLPNKEIYAKRVEQTHLMKELGPDSTGQTAMYNFDIQGSEAVSWGWIDWAKKTIIDNGGTVVHDKCHDLEG